MIHRLQLDEKQRETEAEIDRQTDSQSSVWKVELKLGERVRRGLHKE